MQNVINIFLFSILLYKVCECTSILQELECFADLDYGKLRGERRQTSLKNVPFCSYKGIPYAKPPIGELRFKNPDIVPEPWSGVRDVSKEGKACIQNDLMLFMDGIDVTSEDCLFLNVYTPRARNFISRHDHGLAVMVWIHGGAFLFGSGNENIYGPDFLLEQNIVLVTINYRLGIFGFLNLGLDEAPGNVGLKDQNAALLWVKKYIHLFGGNPNKVTVFGESAGSASVEYHLLSNMSIDLFQNAIMESGSVLAPWAFNKYAKQGAFNVGRILNCTTDNNDDASSLLQCLLKKSSNDLKSTQLLALDKEDKKRGLFSVFLPSIEVPGKGGINFLTSEPAKLLKEGNFIKVPSIIGFNNLEGLSFFFAFGINSIEKINKLNENFGGLFQPGLGLNENDVKFEQVVNEVKKFYFDNQPISVDTIKPLIDLLGDISITTPVQRSIKMMSKHSQKPIYTYEFAVNGNRGPLKIKTSNFYPLLRNISGATHFDELGYLFNFHEFGEMPVTPGSIESEAITRLTTLWTNFAKTGDPNGAGYDGWEPLQIHQDACLYIGNSSINLRTLCEAKRAQFWHHIYSNYISR